MRMKTKIENQLIAIISDIHSNLEALNVVLKDIKSKGIKVIYNLGDIVGYGPNPKECLNRAEDFENIMGNHDIAILIKAFEEEPYMKDTLRKAVQWTREKIERSEKKDDYLNFINNLPFERSLIYNNRKIVMYHGSPNRPIFGYIFPDDIIRDSLMKQYSEKLEKFDIPEELIENFIRMFLDSDRKSLFRRVENICFVGQTHRAGVIVEGKNFVTPEDINNEYEISNEKVVINVGSVGKARDIPDKASYVILKENKVYFHRLGYNAEDTKSKIANYKVWGEHSVSVLIDSLL